MGTIEKKDVPNILAPRGTAKIISSWVEGWHRLRLVREYPPAELTSHVPPISGKFGTSSSTPNVPFFKGYMFQFPAGYPKITPETNLLEKKPESFGHFVGFKGPLNVTGTCFFWPSRKNMSQIGNLLQVGVKNWKIKYVRTHHLEEKSRQFFQFTTLHLSIIRELSSGLVTILTNHLWIWLP